VPTKGHNFNSNQLDVTGDFTFLLDQLCIDGSSDTPSPHSPVDLAAETNITLLIHSISPAALHLSSVNLVLSARLLILPFTEPFITEQYSTPIENV
jgi:hypothetical protein